MSSPLQQQAERMRRDEQVRMAINQRLVESGEKTRLKALLRDKLVECGWRDSLKDHCREVIRNKGLQKITVDELVDEITPRGRATVPDEIKANMLLRIRRFLVAEREEAKEGSGAEGDAPSAAGAGAASLGAN